MKQEVQSQVKYQKSQWSHSKVLCFWEEIHDVGSSFSSIHVLKFNSISNLQSVYNLMFAFYNALLEDRTDLSSKPAC